MVAAAPRTIGCCGGRRLVWIVAAAAMTTLAGCSGSDRLPVAGRVTLDGEPLSGGSITFSSESGDVTVRVNLEADGSYTAGTHEGRGLPPGRYLVSISPTQVGSGEAPLVGDAVESAQPPPIPVRYHRAESSGLTADVSGGAGPFDYDLQP